MPKKKNEDESKKRSKASVTSVVKFGVAAGAGALFGADVVPAVALATLLPGHAIGWLKEKLRERVYKFHEELLNGVPEEEVPRLLAKLTSDDDVAKHYASILEKVYQDDEEEKVGLYAKLLRHLAQHTYRRNARQRTRASCDPIAPRAGSIRLDHAEATRGTLARLPGETTSL